jgi:hypothetical protein
MRQRTWQGGGLARRPNSPPPTGDTSKSCPPLLRFIGRRQSLSAHAVAKSRTNESACARYGLLPNQMPERIGPTWKRAINGSTFPGIAYKYGSNTCPDWRGWKVEAQNGHAGAPFLPSFPPRFGHPVLQQHLQVRLLSQRSFNFKALRVI